MTKVAGADRSGGLAPATSVRPGPKAPHGPHGSRMPTHAPLCESATAMACDGQVSVPASGCSVHTVLPSRV